MVSNSVDEPRRNSHGGPNEFVYARFTAFLFAEEGESAPKEAFYTNCYSPIHAYCDARYLPKRIGYHLRVRKALDIRKLPDQLQLRESCTDRCSDPCSDWWVTSMVAGLDV